MTTYSLDVLFPNFELVPFLSCSVLTVNSCLVYRFLRRQVKWPDIPICLIIFHGLLWSSLHIWKFLIYVLLKPSLKGFEHFLADMWNEHNCVVVWTFLGTALLKDWNENWFFPVLWALLSFPNLMAYWVKHFHSIIFHDYFSLIGKQKMKKHIK